MKVLNPADRTPGPPSEEKIRTLAERARRREPLFPSTTNPEDHEEHDHYLKLRAVHQAFTFYLSFWKANEHDDDTEITYVQIARCINSDPKRPARYAKLLPPPISDSTIKTSKQVWRWHEVKGRIRQMMAGMAIKTLAGRL